MPTVIDNITGASNTSDTVTIELLLIDNECEPLTRYMTVEFHTRNIFMMELIQGIFKDDDELLDELKTSGISYRESNDTNDGNGWYLDFYDETSESYDVFFPSLEDILEKIVSARIIKLKCKID